PDPPRGHAERPPPPGGRDSQERQSLASCAPRPTARTNHAFPGGSGLEGKRLQCGGPFGGGRQSIAPSEKERPQQRGKERSPLKRCATTPNCLSVFDDRHPDRRGILGRAVNLLAS